MPPDRTDQEPTDAGTEEKADDRVARGLGLLRGVATNIGLLLASFGVAGLLAEGAVRLVAPQQLILIRPDLWQPADTVGWLHRSDVSTQINTGERTVDVFTDEHGFRVGSDGPVAAEKKILLLGDSFMEALQVEYEQSTAGLLQSSLTEISNRPLALHNAGIGGWEPSQYALRARSLVPDADYSLVITAVYLGNDVVPQRQAYFAPRTHVERHEFRIPRAVSRREFTDAFLRPLNDFLEVRSHLFLFFRTRLETVRMQLGLAPLNFPRQFRKSASAGPEWSVTADIMAEIDSIATGHGAEALFVLIPAPFQVDSASFMQYVAGFDLDETTVDLDLPNTRLGEELAIRGLRVLDPLPEFRAARDNGLSLYGSVDPHFSPEGNDLLASLVTPVVAELMALSADLASTDSTSAEYR